MTLRFVVASLVVSAATGFVTPSATRLEYRRPAVVFASSHPESWGTLESVQAKALRYSILAGIPATWIFRDSLDAFVGGVWNAVYAWPLAHNCMFEALTASFGFVSAIAFWSSAHLFLWPSKKVRNERVKKFRIDARLPVAPFEWVGQLGWKRLFGAWLPLVTYLGSIAAFHAFVTKAPLPVQPPTFLRFVVELVLGLLIYDLLLIWPIHATLHKGPGWWRKIHRTHHEARPIERRGSSLVPLETVQHSYADGFIQVAANVFVQRLALYAMLPKHPLSRVAHNIAVTYLLAEAHSGYDLPWMSHRVLPSVFQGSLAHDDHHVRGGSNFRQFFRNPVACFFPLRRLLLRFKQKEEPVL